MNLGQMAKTAATRLPAATSPAVNHFANPAAHMSTKAATAAPALNQVQSQLKGVNFTPNKPALPHFATKSWVG